MGILWMVLGLVVVSGGNDTFPVLVGDGEVRRLVTRVVLAIFGWMGSLVGLKAKYKEYSGK